MNTSATAPAAHAGKVRMNRLLPYWAVFQADLQQTLRSWVYRVWVTLSVLVAVGYILYRFGAYQEAGMVQTASELMTDLSRWLILGSLTLVIVLTAGCISSERGTLADSVLSRGISRYQYFLGKWHSRLVCVLTTFLAISSLSLVASYFLLRDDRLTLTGSLVGLAHAAALLTFVVTCSVSVSAMTSSTLLGVAVVWMVLYGAAFGLSFLPPSFPAPDRALRQLPNVMRGFYHLSDTVYLVGWSLTLSLLLVAAGMFYFSRRDV